MANIIITHRTQLNAAVVTESLPGLLYAGENDAHVFIISAVRGDTPVTLAGAVTALFMRPDESTVALNGEIVNGCASVTLPQSCYTQTGRFQLTVFVTENDVKTAVYCLTGNVKKTSTETIIDPGHVVPDISDIIAEYATMQQAVEDCEDAADAANTAASAADAAAANVAGAIADAYSASGTYAVGDYCTKDGKLYRCVSAISTAEAWTAAHWAEVTAMGEVVEITGALGDKLQDVSDNQIIETTEAAAFAYIPDAAKAAAKGVDIAIKPVQAGSGDPSPTNIRAISGWTAVKLGRTGKNLMPMPIQSGSYANGVTIAVNNDKSFYITKTSSSGWTAFSLASGFILKAGAYTLIEDDDGSQNCSLQIRYAGTQTDIKTTRYGKRQVFTLDKDTLVDISYSRSAIADNVLTKVMLFVGDTAIAADYEPYSGVSATYTLPTEAGTVYGGTLHINEDGSGVLTVDKINVVIDGNTVKATSRIQTATVSRFDIPYPSNKKGYYRGSSTYVLCDKLLPSASAVINQSDSTPAGYYCYPHINQFFVTLPGDQTVAECNAWLAENTPIIVYELATPTIYNLTAEQVELLKGANTIYADAGDTAVEYVADTKAYIDNKIAELQALILENI